MTFKTKRFACLAFDAAVLVYATIDTPLESPEALSDAFLYLSDCSAACEVFARESLFFKVEDEYRQQYASGRPRFIPFHYSFKILETFSSDNKTSILMISTLSRSNQTLDIGVRSVVFINGSIYPPKFLLGKRIASDSAVILDSSGSPKTITIQEALEFR